MGAESLNPLEKIKILGQQVDLALDLTELEPIRQRIEQVAQEHPGDPEVQRAAEEAKRLVEGRVARLTPLMPPPPPQPPRDLPTIVLPLASLRPPGGPPPLDAAPPPFDVAPPPPLDPAPPLSGPPAFDPRRRRSRFPA